MIKTILAQLKEFKLPSVLTSLCMVGEVVMEMFIPYLMASIIDEGVEAGNLQHILRVGGIMLIAACTGLFFGIAGGVLGARASTGLARNLRREMFARIQDYSFANIDRFSTPSLITRLTTDVNNVQLAYHMIIRMFVRAPMSMIVAMIMSFVISPRLARIYLYAVILLSIFLVIIMVSTNRYFQECFRKYDEMNASVEENVSSIRVVKAYVREDHERKKFRNASANVYRMFVKAEKRLSLNMPVMVFTVDVCVLLISWIGAHMIIQNTLTTGELMSMLTYCMTILGSLMMMSFIFVMVTMSAASVQRIAEVLNEKSSLTNPEHPDYDIPDGRVDFDHVNFRYREDGEENVLQDIDLHVKSGETIGIIGGTGSAKTTLVNLISRLYDVNDGDVKVGGKDVRSYDLETLRNGVAVVLQKNVLFSGTIYDNLRWGDKNATDEECRHACELACADEFIQRLPDGYNTWIEQGGSNVSGGQKQRLCIARALLKKPKVLILDDSTSAVDTATDAKIRAAFREEIPNMTKFIIAQRVSSVQDADRILVLDNGTVSGFGTHEELLAGNRIYREVYESQTSGGGDFDQPGGES